MSCNGCRVLRKGCSENCMLRPCLQWIESAEAQGHATAFVAKFFGRAGLMNFISAVSEKQRPALFQSLLFEAAGRTVNPVNGAVGMLRTGNWHVCQAAVETVLRGGTLRPIHKLLGGGGPPEMDEAISDCTDMFKLEDSGIHSRSKVQKGRRPDVEPGKVTQSADLHLSITPGFPNNNTSSAGAISSALAPDEKRRLGSPSMNSEESGTTTCLQSNFGNPNAENKEEPKLLNLFN